MADSSQGGKDASGSTKGGHFLERLKGYHLFLRTLPP
jgi:hypothetical protein